MAFSDYQYPELLTEFELTETSNDLFPNAKPVAPSIELSRVMPGNISLVSAIHTEKARSEWLVAPVLREIWGRYDGRINLYSGIEFAADPAAKLTGYCDFIFGKGPQLPRLVAPAVVLVEAKNDTLTNGFGQCISGMVGIQRFNKRADKPDGPIYGAVSTGTVWKFLRLDQKVLTFDRAEYLIEPVDRLLGVLVAMFDSILAAPP